jgi:hypothetical protein
MPFRVRTLQIAWHADEVGRNQPINGLDVHPTLPLLVTCSMDQKVHFWRIRPPPAPGAGGGDASAAFGSAAAAPAPAAAGGAGAGASSAAAKPPQTEIEVEFLFALTGHMRTVNAVRFSPNGASRERHGRGMHAPQPRPTDSQAAAAHATDAPLALPLPHSPLYAGECLATASDGERPRRARVVAEFAGASPTQPSVSLACASPSACPLPLTTTLPRRQQHHRVAAAGRCHVAGRCQRAPDQPHGVPVSGRQRGREEREPRQSCVPPLRFSAVRRRPRLQPAPTPSPHRLRSRTCSGHSADVYDLAWSPDSRYLVSGAVDRTARVWDVVRYKEAARLEGHAQFVQGVAWEPAGHYIATQSNDRSVRVYRTPAGTAALAGAGKPVGGKKGKGGGGSGAGAGSSGSSSADGGAADYPLVAVLKWRDMSEPVGAAAPAAATAAAGGSVTATSSAGGAPAALQPAPAPAADVAPPSPSGGDAAGSSETGADEGAASSSSSSSSSSAAAPAAPAAQLASHGRHALFLDDTFPSFFRRLAWTPDGSLLLAPCGMYRAATGGAPPQFCSYAFDVRGGLAAAPSPPTPSNPLALWPLAELPSPAHGKGTAVIRPCPVPFPLRATTAGGTSGAAMKDVLPHNGAFALPGYRLAYAVAALDSVVLWDSQAPAPIGVAASAHCDKITDMAW